MLLTTLRMFNNEWSLNPVLINRYLKGLFNKSPPKPRYVDTWDVNLVLKYLCTLFPLDTISLRLLTLKLVALIALSTAPRAQTLKSLNLHNMTCMADKILFNFSDLLKTSRQGKNFKMELLHYKDEKLCAMHTLLHYLDRTKNLRKSNQVLVSYCSYKAVTSSTIARWLKMVLEQSGIDTSKFKAHSYRTAAASAAFRHGCSLHNILKTADWTSVKTFQKFYLRDIQANNKGFTEAVVNNI